MKKNAPVENFEIDINKTATQTTQGQFANLPFERRNPFLKGLFIYTDIRKLQDKAKTSYSKHKEVEVWL